MRLAESGSTTMASKEVFSIHDVTTWDTLPHLMVKEEVERHFPAITPPRVHDYDDHQRDIDDNVVQHGLAEGRSSMERAAIAGRLRREGAVGGSARRLRWADCEDDTTDAAGTAKKS